MRPPVIIKSFGYGIYSVHCDLVISKDELCERTGIPITEYISDGKEFFAIASTGHEPSKYEISNISSEEWESIRTVVDAHGSRDFSARLSMLETHRVNSN